MATWPDIGQLQRSEEMKAAALALCAVALGGCAGVADNRGLSSLSLAVRQNGAPLVGAPVVVTSHNQKKDGITDAQGIARFEFTYPWNSYFWIIPPIGSVPRKSPEPEYLIRVAGEETYVRRDAQSTMYDEHDGAWMTSITVEVKKKPNQSLVPTPGNAMPKGGGP